MHIRMEDIKTLLCKIIGSLKISVQYLQIDAILLTPDCFLGQYLIAKKLNAGQNLYFLHVLQQHLSFGKNNFAA